MAYDKALAERVRASIGQHPRLTAKEMFGGIAFMVNGNLACGVHKDGMIVRVGAKKYNEALEKPYVRPFDITGRPMKGWVIVGPQGCQSEEQLKDWVQVGVGFAMTLPEK